MIKTKNIKIPIFKGTLTLCYYDNLKELDNKYELNIPYAYSAVAFSNHADCGYTRYVIAMREDWNVHKLAHEALHIVQMIFRDRGIEKHDVDETEAYLLQWVVENAVKFYEKYND